MPPAPPASAIATTNTTACHPRRPTTTIATTTIAIATIAIATIAIATTVIATTVIATVGFAFKCLLTFDRDFYGQLFANLWQTTTGTQQKLKSNAKLEHCHPASPRRIACAPTVSGIPAGLRLRDSSFASNRIWQSGFTEDSTRAFSVNFIVKVYQARST